MPVYACEVAVAEGLVGVASQIAMVEDHRAVAGKHKKENFYKVLVIIAIRCYQPQRKD